MLLMLRISLYLTPTFDEYGGPGLEAGDLSRSFSVDLDDERVFLSSGVSDICQLFFGEENIVGHFDTSLSVEKAHRMWNKYINW